MCYPKAAERWCLQSALVPATCSAGSPHAIVDAALQDDAVAVVRCIHGRAQRAEAAPPPPCHTPSASPTC